MKFHPKLLTTTDELGVLRDKLSGEKMIAVDTEFIRETTFFPLVALIQVATKEECWLIDPLVFDKTTLRPLLDLLENPGVVKVIHASQADQECFWTAYGVTAKPCFDTALAGSLCGFGDSVGLAKLLKEVLNVSLPKGHARTDWRVRPLPEQLTRYAFADVEHLVVLAEKLIARLEKNKRVEWAFELSKKYDDPKVFEPAPEILARKLSRNGRLDGRQIATLTELIRWREARVRRVNVPRKRIADDDILMDLAVVRPRDIEHLSAFRGLNKGELKHCGQDILNAIAKAAQIPESELPEVPKPLIPTPEEARAIEFLHTFVKIISENLEISNRHMATGEELLPLLRGTFKTVDEMVEKKVITRGAADLIGAELLAARNGERTLVLVNGRVKIEKH